MKQRDEVKNIFTMETKRRLTGLLIVVLFVVYYLATDPDTKIFQDLPFGSGLILTLNIFVISLMSIIMMEVLPDFIVDGIYGRERSLRDRACETSQGASSVMIAKSIRLLGYSFIIAASIISYNMG